MHIFSILKLHDLGQDSKPAPLHLTLGLKKK